MKFCPIIKDECRDDCAFSVTVDYQVGFTGDDHGLWCSIAQAGMALVVINSRLMEISQYGSLNVQVSGGIDTYEQN
jgi:hypothetical protein